MMKILSELKSDDMLCVVGNEGGVTLVDKREYVAFMGDYKGKDVFVADRITARISWENILDIYEDGMHEDWYANLIDEARHNEELKKALTTIQHIFDVNPTYYQGEPVLIDMESED